jgi:hypothetical protein
MAAVKQIKRAADVNSICHLRPDLPALTGPVTKLVQAAICFHSSVAFWADPEYSVPNQI